MLFDLLNIMNNIISNKLNEHNRQHLFNIDCSESSLEFPKCFNVVWDHKLILLWKKRSIVLNTEQKWKPKQMTTINFK